MMPLAVRRGGAGVVNPKFAPQSVRPEEAVEGRLEACPEPVEGGERPWLFVLRDTTVPQHERFGYAANL